LEQAVGIAADVDGVRVEIRLASRDAEHGLGVLAVAGRGVVDDLGDVAATAAAARRGLRAAGGSVAGSGANSALGGASASGTNSSVAGASTGAGAAPSTATAQVTAQPLTPS
jgi:hypothetical protein